LNGLELSIATEIIVIFLLILANGVFAMSEISVVAAKKVRLQQRAEDGDERAKTALALTHDPSQFLATVQVGITMVGVLAGAYGYFVAATPAADRFVCPPTPAPSRAQVANGFVAWMKTRPQLNNDGAIDALFRYAAEAYPCKR